MPRRSAAATNIVKAIEPPRVQRVTPTRAGHLEELFHLNGAAFERNGVSERVLYQLRNWVDTEGLAKVSEALDMSEVTVLRILAGFAHRLRPTIVQKVVGYFRA